MSRVEWSGKRESVIVTVQSVQQQSPIPPIKAYAFQADRLVRRLYSAVAQGLRPRPYLGTDGLSLRVGAWGLMKLKGVKGGEKTRGALVAFVLVALAFLVSLVLS